MILWTFICFNQRWLPCSRLISLHHMDLISYICNIGWYCIKSIDIGMRVFVLFSVWCLKSVEFRQKKVSKGPRFVWKCLHLCYAGQFTFSCKPSYWNIRGPWLLQIALEWVVILSSQVNSPVVVCISVLAQILLLWWKCNKPVCEIDIPEAMRMTLSDLGLHLHVFEGQMTS